MRRSTSAPILSGHSSDLSPSAGSILSIAFDEGLKDDESVDFCPVVSSPWSPLIRWTENPLRLQALTVFTIAANAGAMPDEWNGQPLSVLRRSGEWHNLISAPKLRPSIAYVKQIISEQEATQTDSVNARARGIEWFLLSQLAMGLTSPLERDIQPALITPSQIGCSMAAALPSLANYEVGILEGGVPMFPTDAIDPFERIPIQGRPWGLAAIAFKTPMFEVSNMNSIMQLLVSDMPRLGSRSALMHFAARRMVRDYAESVRLAVRVGMVVSLHSLHVNDIRMLLINEARSPVAPTSKRWFVGIDRAILHFCRDELQAWLEEKRSWRDVHSRQTLIEILRLAQSKYLRAVRDKFERAGIVEGLAVSNYEEKIRLCVDHSFSRLANRLRRGDPVDTLASFLTRNKVWCLVDVLSVVMVEDEVYENGSPSTHEALHEDEAATSKTVSDPASWLCDSAVPDIKAAESEVIHSEPRAPNFGLDPNPNETISRMDANQQQLLSNRPDKLVWLENRNGGYWRCLLPWILLAERSYTIRAGDDGKGLWIQDISAPHRDPRTVLSFQELHDEIQNRIREDVQSVWILSQSMPGSWLDPEVRASLLLLIAGARGDVDIRTFVPCVKRLVAIVRTLAYKNREDMLPLLSDKEKERDQLRRKQLQCLERRDYPCATLATVGELFLPEEVHTCAVYPQNHVTNRYSWIGIRWHEETLLAARGNAKGRTLHAEDDYVLLNSNTFDLETKRASESCDAESWIVGAVTANTIFVPSNSPFPRMETPHVELGVHTLDMLWMAAERALGVKIGVLWTGSGVDPAVILRGSRGVLEQIVAWVPGIRILGSGFSPPPALLNRNDRQYFSRGRFAARMWTQDQIRELFAKRRERLQQELGIPKDSRSSSSSYIAHSVADCVMLFMYIKLDLPLAAGANAGWRLHHANEETVGVRINQPLMMPQSIALRVENENNVEIAVEGETN